MKRIIGRALAVVAFAWAGCAAAGPITDTVTVDGVEWAQVDLFTGLTWNDINLVCPGGVCANGPLNGFDMAGWTWASIDTTNDLFNHYIGFAALGPGPASYTGAVNTFADAFFADGWRANASTLLPSSSITSGYNADTALYWSEMVAFRDAQFICSISPCGGLTNFDRANTYQTEPVPAGFGGTGAWFVRSPTQVPGPAMLPLFGLALAALGFSCRKGKMQS